FRIQNQDMGFQNCPEIQNYGSAAFVRPIYAMVFGYIDSNNNEIKDLETDCGAEFVYSYDANNVGIPVGDGLGYNLLNEVSSSYDANSDYNRNIAWTLSDCSYNSTTGLYDRCFPSKFWIGVVCKNGYYIPQGTPLSQNADLHDYMDVFDTGVCVPAESGYYTNLYDLHKNDENNALANKVGVATGIFGSYSDAISNSNTEFTNLYKQCPQDAYPNSAPATWRVQDCYATVTFKNGDVEINTENHGFNGTSDGVDVTTNPYHISNYQPTPPTDYRFDGWFRTSDFSGEQVTTDTDLLGNIDLFAKFTLERCHGGEYKEDNVCKMCPEGFRDGSDGDSINDCYKNDTISCSVVNPYTSGVGTAVHNQASTSCKIYYNNQSVCVPDNATECMIVALECPTGYKQTGTSLATMDLSLSADSTRYNTSSGMASGDWDATFTYGTVKGTTFCSSESADYGTVKELGTESGKNCWCKLQEFTPNSHVTVPVQDATTPYVFNYSAVTKLECNNMCAWYCAVGIDGILGTNWTESLRVNAFNATQPLRCTAIDYNITYELDGGVVSESNPETYNIETPTFTLHNPTKENYTFIGWCEGDADCADPDVSMDLTNGSIGDKTFYAKWENASYTITYEMNGGTNYVGAPTSYVFGTGATIDGIPIRGNIMVPSDPHYEYVFLGWCTDADLNDCSMTQTISATDSGNKIFYAKWDFYYRIAFNNNFMPEATGNMNTIFVPYTQEIQLPENQYSVPGYNFAGWCYAGEERGTVVSDPVPAFECMNNNKIDYADKAFVVGLTKYNNKENYNDAIPIVELYAQWIPHHYTVEFNANGGNCDISSQYFVYGTNQNLNANQFIRNGYDFAGWCTTQECTDDDEHTLYSNGQSVGNLTTEDNGVINLYAQWTLVEYAIKYYDSTNELSDITPATYTYSSDNQTISPIEPEKRGYTFNGWCVGADNCDNAQKTIEILAETTGIINAYAQWTPNVYNINYYDWENELSGIYPDTYTYSDDENQTKTPNKPSKNGYEFVGWCVGVDGCDEPVNVLE
ncbi:MAG: InlB B-repeat-containing protein, partial [Alphaproteobacteria bacterium]|nr:InlB B-repeat-containing protein [Alphaproteobacteria bacterium]